MPTKERCMAGTLTECLLKRGVRLRVVSNFGDSGEIHARTRMGSCEETRHACISP